MKLELIREDFTEESTIGNLLIDGVFECFILEDKVRPATEPKVFGKTAIPYGTYSVIVTKSTRFSAMAGHDVYLPQLLNVPGFEGVRIHSGNKPDDTLGCLLVGTEKGKNVIMNSRTAFMKLDEKINKALHDGNSVTITIRNASI